MEVEPDRDRDGLDPGVAVAPVPHAGQAQPGADAVRADAALAQVEPVDAAVAIGVDGVDDRNAVLGRHADHPGRDQRLHVVHVDDVGPRGAHQPLEPTHAGGGVDRPRGGAEQACQTAGDGVGVLEHLDDVDPAVAEQG